MNIQVPLLAFSTPFMLPNLIVESDAYGMDDALTTANTMLRGKGKYMGGDNGVYNGGYEA